MDRNLHNKKSETKPRILSQWSEGVYKRIFYYNLKKITKIIIVTFLFGTVFIHSFLHLDFKRNCYIWIKPSIFEFASQTIKDALTALSYVDDKAYGEVCENISSINPNPACNFGGGCFFPDKRKINLKKEIHVSIFNDDNIAWAASLIVHETCHAIQMDNGGKFDEAECEIKDNKVMSKMTQY